MALVEDSLREEDNARLTCPNRRLENVPAFHPPVTIKNVKDSPKTPEKELHDPIDSASFEPVYLTLSLLTTYLPDFNSHGSQSESEETD